MLMRMDDDDVPLAGTFELAVAAAADAADADGDADDTLAELLVAADACCGDTVDDDEVPSSVWFLGPSLLLGALLAVASAAGADG